MDDNDKNDRVLGTLIQIVKELGLLDGDNGKANHNAILANARYATELLLAISSASDSGLLTGASTQANFNAILANAQYATEIGHGLSKANKDGLLTGESAQANRDTISAAGQYAYDVIRSLPEANKRGLLTGESAQANRDTIAAAGRDAYTVVHVLSDTKNQELLTGDGAQANRKAIAAAGFYAMTAASALLKANQAGLLTAESAQANRDDIVTAGLHAPDLVSALIVVNRVGLLTGDYAQLNRNAIRAHAASIWHVLSIAERVGLLKGDSAQANFSAIAASAQNGEEIKCALSEAESLSVLTEENLQANFTAIMTIAPHGKTFAEILQLARLAGFVSNTNKQNIFDSAVLSVNAVVGDSELLEKFYHSICYFPSIINHQIWEKTLKLNQDEVASVYGGINILIDCSLELLTLATYELLLSEGVHANSVAELLTGRWSKEMFTQNLLETIQSFPKGAWKNSTDFSEQHYELYKRFSKPPHQFDIDQLAGIVQLTHEQAERLLGLTHKDSIDILSQQLLRDEPEDILVHILAEQYLITHLYYKIPQHMRTELPRQNDYESSMRDDFINLARERIEVLKNEVKFESTQLDAVEIEIRRFLLLAIKSELEEEKSMANGDEKALLEEKIALIAEHGEALALRHPISPELLKKAVSYFSSTLSVNQTAWRAYESTAPCVNWPNLLTVPNANSASNIVFSTHASAQGQNVGALTEESASTEARTWSAICFLASQKHPQMQQDFIYSLAEIRRAHNHATTGTDDPSCQPGTLSRFLTAINKHPQFTQTNKPVDSKQVVEQKISALAQQSLNEMSLNKHGLDAQLLLCALHLYSPNHHQNNEVLRKKEFIEYILAVDEEALIALEMDAPEDAQNPQHVILSKSQQLRQQFMQNLLGEEGTQVYNAVVDKLRASHLDYSPQMLHYLIAKQLANLPQIISIPNALLMAGHSAETPEIDKSPAMTESDRFKQALFKEYSSEIESARDKGEHLNAAICELTDSLNRHLMSQGDDSYTRVKIHASVVQTKLEQLENNAELTVERVCKVLREIFNPRQPDLLSQQQGIINSLATMRGSEETPTHQGSILHGKN